MSNKTYGWIYLLPSESINVVVKYYPKWLISCVLPETTREITAKRVDFQTDVLHQAQFKIKTPDLILTHSIAKPWDAYGKTTPYYAINRIDLTKKAGIFANPYQLANVYSSGHICFGDTTFGGVPRNLREANNIFWSTPFNEDNCPYFDDHLGHCYDKKHEYLDPTHPKLGKNCRCECCINECGCICRCDLNKGFFEFLKSYYDRIIAQKPIKKTKYFCGDKYFASPEPATAVFISNKKPLLKKLPETSWRQDGQGSSVVIGVAKLKSDTHWSVDLGSTSFSIPKSQVILL